jgi:hypothetical protein
MSGDGEEIGVFIAALHYLHTQPPIAGRLPCFEHRILRRDASQAPLVKVDQIFAFVDDSFPKIMPRCSYDRQADEDKRIRYQFYQPKIGHGNATIQVDYRGEKLHGRGLTLELKRKEEGPDWYVTSVGIRWFS